MTGSGYGEDRREVVDRYFAPVPGERERQRVWGFLLGGAALLLVGVALSMTDSWPVGIPLVIGGGAAVVRGFPLFEAYRDAREAALPKPRDAIIDKIRDHELAKVRLRALDRLDLTTEDLELEPADWDPLAQPLREEAPREPLVVTGPVPTSGAVVGRDGVWRFSQYAVLVICPTDYHLGLYRCVIDLRVAGLFQEETHEYHYADVVAVSTAIREGTRVTAQIADADDGDHRFERTLLHEFQLVVSSGDRSAIVVGISDGRHPDHQARLAGTGIDPVVRAVRGMLRDKKAPVRQISSR
ncbi:hypothetical protein [Amycolatopsis sp. cmx-4-83]|uniref:hypothetical protein n=1 Tax=Amycolatopsis sp. cmx-4-83 TaxID=2790940 RepID=UPI00397A30BE